MLPSGIEWEVIVVDDASPDGTQEVCQELMALFNTGQKDHIVRAPSCSLVTPGGHLLLVLSFQVLKPRPGKLGLGTAYIYGMKFARGSFIILMDADMSHHACTPPFSLALWSLSPCVCHAHIRAFVTA